MSATSMPVCLEDFENFAREHLPRKVFNSFASGASQEQTLQDNKQAFKRIRLRPRLMRDVSSRDTSISILGQRIAFPVAIAPTAKHKMAHPDGEVATIKGAASMGTGMIASCWSTTSLEDIANAAPNCLRWLDMLIFKDRQLMRKIIRRAEATGYKALFITVDCPVLGKRTAKADLPKQYTFPVFADINGDEDRIYSASYSKVNDPSATWEAIDWIKSTTSLPIVLKGILTAEDAREAVKHKVDGILVSNHGARQLDGVFATIDALPEVVEAVRGSNIEVYMDGGVRKGTDVLKAIALGARAVFIGRSVLWGLAYDGQNGVKKVLEILRDEFDLAMALSGCRNVHEITPDLVERRTFYSKL